MMRPRELEDPRNTGVLLRKELLASGYDDYAIVRLVRDGVLVRVRRGAYVDRKAHEQLDEVGRHGLRARAVVKQAKTAVVLSHVSGLPEYDAPTWGFDLRDIHVTRLDGKLGRHEAGVHQHCGRVLSGDVVTRNGVEVMSATRLALEVTTLVGVEPALGVMNHLLRHGLTSQQQLAERYAGMEQWPNSLPTDVVLRLADPRIESLGETRTFFLLHRQGLPMPVPQYEIRDENGVLIARVDFAWPELGVFLEFDGKIKYEKLLKPGQRASDVVIAEKRREELVCRLTGWRCIRITWADLATPEHTAAMIREEFTRAARGR